VTTAQVNEAARLVLGQGNHATGILLPAAAAAAPAPAPATGGTK
jgi:hypothetical protein